MSYLILAIIILLTVVIVGSSLFYGRSILSVKWLLFFIRCSHFKVAPRQQRQLLKILREQNIANPNTIFSDSMQLNAIIASLTQGEQPNDKTLNNSNLLKKLYQIRGVIEQQALTSEERHTTLINTRQIVHNQRFTIDTNEEESHHANLVMSDEYLILTFESEPNHVARQVNAYFWHQGVGYGFQSAVAKREGLTIFLPHNETLLKRQRRSQKRAEAGFPAEFFLTVKNSNKRYFFESEGGFPCQLKDISEGGAALMAEGRGQVNLNIKVQFTIGERKVIMCGEVKAVTYDPVTNFSTLHLQSDEQMPFEMREPILAYVYGIKLSK